MAFKVYDTLADYNADMSLQKGETRISLIRYEDAQKTSLINLVRYDAVNRVTTQPMIGDLVFINNENPSNPKIVFREGGKYASGAKPADWEFVGFVYFRDGKNIGVIHKYGSDRKWLDVAQYAWTDPVLDGSKASKTIGIRCAINWGVNTTVTLNYQVPQDKAYDGGSDMLAKAETMEYLAGEMQTAIETQLADAGATAAEIALWHCYVQYKTPSPNSEIAYTSDSGINTPLRIIIQRDSCDSSSFYQCSGLAHVTWQRWDKTQNENQGSWVSMSEGTGYYKVNGKIASYQGGIMNFARGEAYFSNNGRTPTANIAVGSESGNTNPVKKAVFETSDYCAALREYYGTYNAYLRGEFGIMFPQNYGAFNLPDGETMARDWAAEEAPTKGFKTQNGIDTTKFKKKFPAMWFGRSLYGSSPSSEQTAHIALLNKFKYLAMGQWHLPSLAEGVRIMRDETIEELQKSTTSVGIGIATAINNSTFRWWAARYNILSAWFFNGTRGHLNGYNNSHGVYCVQAVTLLNLDNLNDAPEGQTE